MGKVVNSRRWAVALILALTGGVLALPTPAVADSVNVVDPNGALGGVVGTLTKPPLIVPLIIPANFDGVAGFYYNNADDHATSGTRAGFQFTTAGAAGTLYIGSCTATTGAVALAPKDGVSGTFISRAYINYATFEGPMVAVGNCNIAGRNFLPGTIAFNVVLHFSNDPRLGGGAIWGWVDLSSSEANAVLFPGFSSKTFFLSSSNADYVSSVLGGISKVLGSGLVKAPANLSCPNCLVGQLSTISNATQLLQPFDQSLLSTTEASASSSASTSTGQDLCAQTKCMHELAFYHGPSVGMIRNTQLDTSHYLNFHFGTNPQVPQNEMTYDGSHCAAGAGGPPGQGCYDLGDVPAAATAQGYPKDEAGYVKDFNAAAWLSPQEFLNPNPSNPSDPNSCNGCDTIEQIEFDVQWDPNQMQAGTILPSNSQCAQKTRTDWSAGVDFGVGYGFGPFTASLHGDYSPSGNDQICLDDSQQNLGHLHWTMQPDPYTVNLVGSGNAAGVQVGLKEIQPPQKATSSFARAWSAVTFTGFRCADQSYPPCPSGETSFPAEFTVASNPSGTSYFGQTADTGGGAYPAQGDLTTGHFVLDDYQWRASGIPPTCPSCSPEPMDPPAPNGSIQDWVVGPAGPAGACNEGLTYVSDHCTQESLLGAGADAQFSFGYMGEQRAGTRHTVTAKIFDLANNLGDGGNPTLQYPDATIEVGGPGTNLSGIGAANRTIWMSFGDPNVPQSLLEDSSLHEIQIFDHPDYDPNTAESQEGIDPPSWPIASYDFGVEPCPATADPGTFSCPTG